MLVLKDNIALNLNHFVLLALDTHTLILAFLYSYSYSPLGTLKSSSDLIYVIYIALYNLHLSYDKNSYADNLSILALYHEVLCSTVTSDFNTWSKNLEK